MEKVLIVSRQQFGYLIDIYKWCEYIDEKYQVNILTFGGKEKITLDRPNVKVHYVSHKGNKSTRGIRYVLVSLWYILFFKGHIIVEYFNGCDIFKKLLPWKKMILDIRTLSVKKDERGRVAENAKIKQACEKYDFVTIISEGTRKAISLDENKSAILPLGADIISTTDKNYDELRLLYVGTLSGRDIDKTIKGINIYIKNNPRTNIHYDIIGDGLNDELNTLKKLVEQYNIEEYVTLHGYIRHNEIDTYLDKCNIGVSFVPITQYYEHQPPTKTYEYILSGLYTIATGTLSNKEIVTKDNGIIINDNADSFATAISQIKEKSKLLNSKVIRTSLSESTWENIVANKFETVLNKLKSL